MTPRRQVVSVRNPNDGEPLAVVVADNAEMLKQLRSINSLIPAHYDQITIAYERDLITAVRYWLDGKLAGAVELTYNSRDQLTTVTWRTE